MSLMHGLDEERRHGNAVVRLAFLVTTFEIGIDQAIKSLVLTLGPFGVIPIVEPGLRLVIYWTRGESFDFIQSSAWYLTSSLGIGVLALAALGSTRRITGIAFGLLIGGMISNVIDRVRFGAVLQYLLPSVMGLNFGVINLADVGIFFGLAMLLIDQFFIAGAVYVSAASRVARSARPRFRP